MKVVCQREGLLSACQLASVAVAARDVKPVLKNLKAVVDNERCTLMATDLELGIRLEVRGIRVEEPGEALLPTGRFVSILRESTDEEMTVEAGPDGCRVLGASNEFDMPGEDPAAFPEVPTFDEEKYHELTAGAAARDDPPHVVRGGHRRAVALRRDDGHPLGAGRRASEPDRDRRPAAGAGEGHRGRGRRAHDQGQTPVVPAKAMNLLDRNLSEAEEKVRISFRANEVLMKTERAMVYSRLVEGRFPDWRKAMPQKQVGERAVDGRSVPQRDSPGRHHDRRGEQARALPVCQGQADAAGPGSGSRPIARRAADRVRRQGPGDQLRSEVRD